MPKKIDGIATLLRKSASIPLRVYGTELARGDEVVITHGADMWKGRIVQVNTARTVARVIVSMARPRDEPYEVEKDDQTIDDDLAAITITITGTPGSANGNAVVDP